MKHSHDVDPVERICDRHARAILEWMRGRSESFEMELYAEFASEIDAAIHEAIAGVCREQLVLMRILHDRLAEHMGEEELHAEMERLKKSLVN